MLIYERVKLTKLCNQTVLINADIGLDKSCHHYPSQRDPPGLQYCFYRRSAISFAVDRTGWNEFSNIKHLLL